jgi:hypothetical protein
MEVREKWLSPLLPWHSDQCMEWKEQQMRDRQKTWIWLAAAISFGAGLLLVLHDSAAGWIFIILGISYPGLLTRGGQAWAASDPRLVRVALIGTTVLLGLLAAILAVVLSRR